MTQGVLKRAIEQLEYLNVAVRAKLDHPSRVIKRQFGYITAYSGEAGTDSPEFRGTRFQRLPVRNSRISRYTMSGVCTVDHRTAIDKPCQGDQAVFFFLIDSPLSSIL